MGLLKDGALANWLGRRLSFDAYKLTVFVDYIVHGAAYVLFSRAQRFDLALLFIFSSRGVMAVNSVLNYSSLPRTVANRYRGRVFSTIETVTWTTMMISMMGDEFFAPGFCSGKPVLRGGFVGPRGNAAINK